MDIKSVMGSELRFALPLFCHAATWSEMNGRMGAAYYHVGQHIDLFCEIVILRE
jgi:hypothetical protein